jgi:hypothetical protein
MRGMTLTPIAIAALLLAGCGVSTPPHANSWLSYRYNFSCNGCADLTDEVEAWNYYCAIGVDPTGCANSQQPTLTLDDWKAANGFPATGHPDAYAAYGNLGDLRIGRDMNCVQSSNQSVACYVTNYGSPPFGGHDQIDHTNCDWAGCQYWFGTPTNLAYYYPFLSYAINDAIDGRKPFATVAMTFTPNTGAANNANAVGFYVFDDQGGLRPSAALDGEGNKSVPRMCMACHGGTYDANTHSVTGASFLPFDAFYFQYSRRESDDYGQSFGHPEFSLDNQQESLRKLNAIVKATSTPPASQAPSQAQAAILEFIDGLYPDGVDNSGSIAVDGWVPTGWSADAKLYNGVVKQYCRMCHLAQTSTFATHQQFKNSAAAVEDYVCNGHDMPNAQVPFAQFWQDALAKADLRDFLKGEGITNLHDCK